MRRASVRIAGLLALAALPRASADDWPQWRGPTRDGAWRETGIVETLPETLDVVWRRAIGGGFAGPAIVGDRVFVTDRMLATGESNPDDPFDRSRITRGSERVLCLDAETGDIVWALEYPCGYQVSYPCGPRVTPTVEDGRLYTVGAMGHAFALDARTGDLLWSRNFLRDYGVEINTWGYSSHPLVDGPRVIFVVGGEDSGVVAFDKVTGREVWRALRALDPGYSPPMIYDIGGTRQLIVWTPTHVNSLDPESGRLLWQVEFPVKASLTAPTPIVDAARSLLFVTAFYDGPMMLSLGREAPSAEVLWRGSSRSEIETDGLHSIIPSPFIAGEHIYGVCSYGQLRCLEVATGKRVWETRQATGEGRWWNAFLTPHEDRWFIANEQGDLITAKLSPAGYEETSRSFLIAPTGRAQRRQIVWSHPAYAHRSVFARNDAEIIRVDLSKPE